jgi:ABC-type nitrate/sulfonate/bicarbonate transport system ATPase subunit
LASLLLDEPFSALDVLTKYTLQKLVADMCVQEHLTTVLVTHDIDEALYFSDRIAILSSSPATIQDELTIVLPRPRCRTSEAFESYRFKLLNYYLKKFGEPEVNQ